MLSKMMTDFVPRKENIFLLLQLHECVLKPFRGL